MSLPFVTKGKPCPNYSKDSIVVFKPLKKKKKSTFTMSFHATKKKKKLMRKGQPFPPWRPPPCKFENRVKKTGSYCSVCAPSYNKEEDSLENLKDLNSSIHRLDEEIRRQKGKVLNDLIRMNDEEQMDEGTWRTRFSQRKFKEDSGLVCTCNLNYQSLKIDETKSAIVKSSQSTNVSESIKKDVFIEGIESDSTDSSSMASSFKKVHHQPKRKKKRTKNGVSDLSSKETTILAEETDSKVLKTAIMQLRNENECLKSALSVRECKLREAGKKIEDILEQNSLLTQRLKEIIFNGNVQTSNSTTTGGPPPNMGSTTTLELKAFNNGNHPKESYQKELSLLRQKLSDSQIANRNLETYIEYLKKSYVSVFGSNIVCKLTELLVRKTVLCDADQSWKKCPLLVHPPLLQAVVQPPLTNPLILLPPVLTPIISPQPLLPSAAPENKSLQSGCPSGAACKDLGVECLAWCHCPGDCIYGGQTNATCNVHHEIHCEGPKTFNKLFTCQYCYQEPTNYVCSEKLDCDAVAQDPYYLSNCTVSQNGIDGMLPLLLVLLLEDSVLIGFIWDIGKKELVN
ncbi:unnamed protein product [Lepeophtheirus salmonis]|uniref:(salmon louse) hypothetical protein n=1 Tax=Lepeophtheirus salmonis TaxID=72036 RepID=A0A7R8H147_LEPSM|nr:unnamed protein product [Lepeophtheirus salmonis]CAF2782306.1 unnamed protein product [Lepeophtheirus salmonis]